MSRRMLQRHKHLLSPMTPAGDVILHNREAAREAVLVPETLEDPLRRMLLFPRARLVVEENPVDHRDERIKLRLGRRLCAHVTRRRRELHHLGDRARVDSNPLRRRPVAQPLDLNRVANAPIKLHALHPPPSADPTQRDICCRTFAPALPENPAASVRDYCSGAYSLRQKLWSTGEWVFSGEATAFIPGAHDSHAPAQEGNTGWAGEARLNAGRNFALSSIPFLGSVPGFLDAEVAYRLRTEGPPDEWHGDVTLGFKFTPKIMLMLQDYTTVSMWTKDPTFPAWRSSVAEASLVYALNDNWSIQAGVFSTVWTVKTNTQHGAVVAVWWNF